MPLVTVSLHVMTNRSAVWPNSRTTPTPWYWFMPSGPSRWRRMSSRESHCACVQTPSHAVTRSRAWEDKHVRQVEPETRSDLVTEVVVCSL